MNHENIMLKWKKLITKDKWFHFYQMSRVGKCLEIDQWLPKLKKGVSVMLRCVIFVFSSFFKIIFYWSLVALQYRVGFCHTWTWLGHRYTYVPSPLNIPPPPTPPHPSRLSQSTILSSLHHTANPPWLLMFHMVMCMFQYYSRFVPPSRPPLCHQVCPLRLHLHPALQIHSSMLSPRFHVYVSGYDVYISLSDFLHSV